MRLTPLLIVLAYTTALVPHSLAATAPPARVRVFDTIRPSAALSDRDGWKAVPPGDTAYAFQGDAVVLTGALTVAFLPQGQIALHGAGRAPERRIVVETVPAVKAETSLAIESYSDSKARIRVLRTTPSGRLPSVICSMVLGQPLVRVESDTPGVRVRVTAPARFVVVPDFFANDLVVDGRMFPAPVGELAADHLLLHMLGDGDALATIVRRKASRDVIVDVTGQGASRRIKASTVALEKDDAVWVALQERAGIWHTRAIAKNEEGQIIPLDWQRPFPAQWRVDWRRDDGLTSSWEIAVPGRHGEFRCYGGVVPSHWVSWPTRKRYTPVLHQHTYPCWFDRGGAAFLQPLGRKHAQGFDGPAVIYPIDRVEQTPLGAYTLVDITRLALGVGPCQYVLDVEGQRAVTLGKNTCATARDLRVIYQSGQQVRRQADIEKALDDVIAFIRGIRKRIDAYRAFAKAAQAYLAEQKKAQPALARPLADLDAIVAKIDQRYARRRGIIGSVQDAEKLAEEFRTTLIVAPSKTVKDRAFAITGSWQMAGQHQDELVSECREIVRNFRQQAALAAVSDARLNPIVRELRARTHQVLRGPVAQEYPRN